MSRHAQRLLGAILADVKGCGEAVRPQAEWLLVTGLSRNQFKRALASLVAAGTVTTSRGGRDGKAVTVIELQSIAGVGSAQMGSGSAQMGSPQNDGIGSPVVNLGIPRTYEQSPAHNTRTRAAFASHKPASIQGCTYSPVRKKSPLSLVLTSSPLVRRLRGASEGAAVKEPKERVAVIGAKRSADAVRERFEKRMTIADLTASPNLTPRQCASLWFKLTFTTYPDEPQRFTSRAETVSAKALFEYLPEKRRGEIIAALFERWGDFVALVRASRPKAGAPNAPAVSFVWHWREYVWPFLKSAATDAPKSSGTLTLPGGDA